MKDVPQAAKSFANDLYAYVVADKELIQLFLKDGEPKQQLSEAERAYDEANSIANPPTPFPDDSESSPVILKFCNGVFTDAKGTVYFWRLSSPRILHIMSQNYDATFLVLKEEHLDLLHGYKK